MKPVSDIRQDEAQTRTVREGGVVWHVFEHTPDYDRRGQATLVFLSDEAFHRVRDFPAGWALLPDGALLALRHRR